MSAVLIVSIGTAVSGGTGASGAVAAPPDPVEIKAPGSPVAQIEQTVTQPDGATFQAVPWGDASLDGLETVDGYTVVQTDDGEWRYADGLADDGSLAPTAVRPDEGPAPAVVEPGQRPAASQVETLSMPLGSAMPGLVDAPFRENVGTARSLVILTDFTDQTPTTTQAQWATKFFGATESVKDYFDEVSYGALNLQPAAESGGTGNVANNGVVGWLELTRVHPNSGFTNSGDADQFLALDAIAAADPFVDYASFDTNGNGVVEPFELHITVIAAGYETAYTGASPSALCGSSVWGHQWSLDAWQGSVFHPDKTVQRDGVWVGGHGGNYTMFGEKHCSRFADAFPSTGHMATLGIMVHELGHSLGLPDLYDTFNEGAGGTSAGVGYWSLMAYNWGFTDTAPEAGSRPSHPDAWSKVAEGWVDPKQVSGPVTIQQAETAPDVHQILPNPAGVDWNFVEGDAQAGTGEYFLVENRQQVGYDEGIPGAACGLLIWHIDETRPGNNRANTFEARRLVDVEEADGLGQLDSNTSFGDAGDPWPGTSVKTAFNDASTPNSRLYDAVTPSGVAVSNISAACGSSMTATITSPGPFPPAAPTIGTAKAGKNVNATVAFTPGSTGGAATNYLATCTSTNLGATRSKTGAASPLVVTNLTAGKTYTCRVVATNLAGSSPPSAASNAIKAVKPPSAPRNVAALPRDNAARVSFDAPASIGGSAITKYQARCVSSNGGVTKNETAAAGPILVTGLSQGKRYKCDVRAKNVAGWSPFSALSDRIVPT